MSADHGEVIQSVAALVLGRLARDLDHVAATLEDAGLRDTMAVDVLNTLTDASTAVHALTHRLDDDMLAWVQERHTAAVLVESATE